MCGDTPPSSEDPHILKLDQNLPWPKPEEVKILAAFDTQGQGFILQTNSQSVKCDIEAVGTFIDDLGIKEPDNCNGKLMIWEGKVTYSGYGSEDDVEPTYTGAWRDLGAIEWAKLAMFSPPFSVPPEQDQPPETPPTSEGNIIGT
jgi:hypothetical protein